MHTQPPYSHRRTTAHDFHSYPRCSVTNLPAHAPLIATLVALCDKRDAGLGAAVLRQLGPRLAAAFRDGHPSHARMLTRFLACLGAVGAARAEDVAGALSALVSAAEDAAEEGEHREAAFVLYAALSALPYFANASDSPAATLGAGSPDVPATLHGVVARAAHIVGTVTKPRDASVRSLSALTSERQHAVGEPEAWLDIPPERASALPVAALAATSLERLVAAVAERLEGGGDTAVSSEARQSHFCRLAVATIARPTDDAAIARALVAPADKSLGGGRGGSSGSAQKASRKSIAEAALQPPSYAVSNTMITDDVDIVAAAGGLGAEANIDDADVAVDSGSAAAPARFAPVVRLRGGGYSSTANDSDEVNMAGDAAAPTPPRSRHLLRPPVAIFGAGGLSSTPAVAAALGLNTPAAAPPLATHLLRDIAHDVLLAYAPFHDEAADALLDLPMGATLGRGARAVPSAPLAVDAVLSQLLWSPAPPLSPNFYAVVIINMLAAEGAAAADGDGDAGAAAGVSAALGLAVRVLWKNAALLDDVSTRRLAAWMAHHVSNMKWAWMWGEWGGAASRGLGDAQARLLHRLLEETFALIGPWHYDRIVGDHFRVPFAPVRAFLRLPAKPTDAAASVLLPAVTAGTGPTTDAGAADPTDSGTGGGVAGEGGEGAGGAPPSSSAVAHLQALQALARAALVQLQAKATDEAMREALAGAATPEDATLALTHALLMHGRANMRNAGVLAERYRGALSVVRSMDGSGPAADSAVPSFILPSGVGRGDDVRAHIILAATQHVWRRARHVGAALASATLVGAGVVTAAQVVSFALEPTVVFPRGHPLGSDDDVDGEHEGSDAQAAAAATSNTSSWPDPVVRALDIHVWNLVSDALAAAGARATAAATALALFRGEKVLDEREPELDAVAASEAEDALLTRARAATEAHHAVLAAALAAVAKLARTLQQLHFSASADSVVPTGEALRVVLSQLRAIALACVESMQPALIESSVNRARDDALREGGKDNTHDAGAELVEAVLQGVSGMTRPPPRLTVPPALLRDAEAPRPADIE